MIFSGCIPSNLIIKLGSDRVSRSKGGLTGSSGMASGDSRPPLQVFSGIRTPESSPGELCPIKGMSN